MISRITNPIGGADLFRWVAEMYIMVKEYDLAIDQLHKLLSVLSDYSATFLKHWPDFIPISHHPRFQALLEKDEDQ